MATTLAFDIYGTLINPYGIAAALNAHMEETQALAFAELWRNKQLEYSFRRGLMGSYENFSVCTQQALDYTCASCRVDLSTTVRAALLDEYRRLPAFDDVPMGLAQLSARDHRLFAFSNGLASDVQQLLQHAAIDGYFQGVISVDGIKSFKPDPVVYQHFLQQTGAQAATTWLISSNPFDVIGALASGWRAVWVQRDVQAPFDPWSWTPTAVVKQITELTKVVFI